MNGADPTAEPGAGITADEFLDCSIRWAIHHLEDARRRLKAGDVAEFHAAIRKFGACTNALLDTVPEIGANLGRRL